MSCGSLNARSCRYIGAITSTSPVTSKFWLSFYTLSRVKFSIDSAKRTASQLVAITQLQLFVLSYNNLPAAKECNNRETRPRENSCYSLACYCECFKMQNWFYLAKAIRARVVKLISVENREFSARYPLSFRSISASTGNVKVLMWQG